VLIHVDFKADMHRQRAWLADNARPEWIEGLALGVKELMIRLARLPACGPVVTSDARIVVRKIFLRRLPYVVWYAHRPAEPIGDITLLRLFGYGQSRPDPSSSVL